MENINYYPRVYLKPDKTNNPISFSGIRHTSVETFQKTLKDVIQKDSGNQKFGFSTEFLDMACYDMDMVVKSLGGNNKESMDCCISIGSYDAGRDIYLNPRWLLVELKLNSQVAKNDKRDLEDKVTRTVELIARGKIEQVKVFIYTIGVYSRKRSLFESWKKGTDKSKYLLWECLSPKGFEDFLRLRQNIPYKNIIKRTQIEESFIALITLDQISNQLSYWRDTAEAYRRQGYTLEYRSILSIMADIYKRIHTEIEHLDDRLLFELEWDFLLKFCGIND